MYDTINLKETDIINKNLIFVNSCISGIPH